MVLSAFHFSGVLDAKFPARCLCLDEVKSRFSRAFDATGLDELNFYFADPTFLDGQIRARPPRYSLPTLAV
jgi:hypothetical protein